MDVPGPPADMKPRVDIPPTLRLVLYVLTSIGSLAATYLSAKGIIGGAEVGLWTGFVTLVAAIAAAKTDTSRVVKSSAVDSSAPESDPKEV